MYLVTDTVALWLEGSQPIPIHNHGHHILAHIWHLNYLIGFLRERDEPRYGAMTTLSWSKVPQVLSSTRPKWLKTYQKTFVYSTLLISKSRHHERQPRIKLLLMVSRSLHIQIKTNLPKKKKAMKVELTRNV